MKWPASGWQHCQASLSVQSYWTSMFSLAITAPMTKKYYTLDNNISISILSLPFLSLRPSSIYTTSSQNIKPMTSICSPCPLQILLSSTSTSNLSPHVPRSCPFPYVPFSHVFLYYQGCPAPWRKEWQSPQPWLRVVSLTWSNGKTGACRQWAQVASLRPASPPRSGKRSGGWKMMLTVTSAMERRRPVSLQVRKHTLKNTGRREVRPSTEPVNGHQQNYVLITSRFGICASCSANQT